MKSFKMFKAEIKSEMGKEKVLKSDHASSAATATTYVLIRALACLGPNISFKAVTGLRLSA